MTSETNGHNIMKGQSWMTSEGNSRSLLPHLGTCVIDAPRDKNWNWRQEYLYYQQTHRGVLKNVKVDPLPQIPKRYDLKTFLESRQQTSGPTSPSTSGASSQSSYTPGAPGVDDRLTATTPYLYAEKQHSGTITRSLDNTPIIKNGPLNQECHQWNGRPSYRGSVSWRPPKVPRGREVTVVEPSYMSLCTHKDIQVTSSLRVRTTLVGCDPKTVQRKKKIPPREAIVKIKDIFSNDRMASPVSPTSEEDGKGEEEAQSSLAILRATPPVKHVGHTSRVKDWANLRLAEVLRDQSSHGVSPSDYPLKSVRRSKRTSDQFIFDSATEGTRDDVLGLPGGRSWLQMVNTPLVDRAVYDKYANVKLTR